MELRILQFLKKNNYGERNDFKELQSNDFSRRVKLSFTFVNDANRKHWLIGKILPRDQMRHTLELPSGSHVASQATKNAFLSRKPEIPTHVKISERLFFVSWEEEAKWNETF